MSAFLYQKGFVAEYLLTGNRAWLAELETSRPAFETWLASRPAEGRQPPRAELLDADPKPNTPPTIEARQAAIALYDAGRMEEAKAELDDNHVRTQRLRDSVPRGRTRAARTEAERAFGHIRTRRAPAGARAGRHQHRGRDRQPARRVLVGAPDHEADLRAGGPGPVGGRAHAHQGRPGRAGSETLGDQVGAMVEKLEETDAALAEHRRRLMQSEKLSAVGELAAKLAHEVLNPLAGMKAAVQLLARQGAVAPGGAEVVDTAEALNREITRVEGLMRRLMIFARPLAPRVEVVTVELPARRRPRGGRDRCLTRRQRHASSARRSRICPRWRSIRCCSRRRWSTCSSTRPRPWRRGRPRRAQAERARRGARARRDRDPRRRPWAGNLADAHLRELFKPFFTTKPDGHGLGLAVSQNILLEHGGRIIVANRPPARARARPSKSSFR